MLRRRRILTPTRSTRSLTIWSGKCGQCDATRPGVTRALLSVRRWPGVVTSAAAGCRRIGVIGAYHRTQAGIGRRVDGHHQQHRAWLARLVPGVLQGLALAIGRGLAVVLDLQRCRCGPAEVVE